MHGLHTHIHLEMLLRELTISIHFAQPATTQHSHQSTGSWRLTGEYLHMAHICGSFSQIHSLGFLPLISSYHIHIHTYMSHTPTTSRMANFGKKKKGRGWLCRRQNGRGERCNERHGACGLAWSWARDVPDFDRGLGLHLYTHTHGAPCVQQPRFIHVVRVVLCSWK